MYTVKKLILLLVIIIFTVLFLTTSNVLAGGGQVTGGTGNGKGNQSTYEYGCASQPCFYDAPQPKSSP
jgi:hypothetical protein